MNDGFLLNCLLWIVTGIAIGEGMLIAAFLILRHHHNLNTRGVKPLTVEDALVWAPENERLHDHTPQPTGLVRHGR